MLIGIDLGTATSEVAILRNGRPQRLRGIASAPHGFLPSVVGFAPDGTLAVGTAAEALLIPYPERAVAEVKRLMGTDARVMLAGDEYTPAEISAILLRHLKQEAERELGVAVTEAIITVPAYFTNAQRQATRDAGEMAGLRVRRLINEPTAAALAYGIERPGVEEKILVYDLGGGTLDVTVLELSEGVLDVLASTGNTRLGGKDFDERTMQFVAAQCKAATGVDLYATPQLQQRLKAAARGAKEALSSADTAPIVLDLPAGEGTAPRTWSYTLTRAAFEAQVDDLVTSTAAQMDEALRAKKISPAEITTVLMIGGSTRIPLVRSFVSAYFGGRPLRTDVDPDEAVCLGAAVLAGIESEQVDASALVVTDVAPHTLGVAVVREGDLFGADDDSNARYFDPLIPKQSTVPRTARKMYQTANDWQRAVRVQVYQGDNEMVAQNEHVGEFVLDGLPPSPAGSPVEIEFSYNLSGELEVVARARQWGIERRVTMQPSRRSLSTEQKATSRARLDRAFADNPGRTMPSPMTERHDAKSAEPGWRTSRHYSRVAALLGAADRALPTLPAEKVTEVAALVRAIRGALERDDVQLLERDERTLTDLLFDLT